MPIGKVWIHRLLFVCLFVCVCVWVCLYGYGFLASGITFCTRFIGVQGRTQDESIERTSIASSGKTSVDIW